MRLAKTESRLGSTSSSSSSCSPAADLRWQAGEARSAASISRCGSFPVDSGVSLGSALSTKETRGCGEEPSAGWGLPPLPLPPPSLFLSDVANEKVGMPRVFRRNCYTCRRRVQVTMPQTVGDGDAEQKGGGTNVTQILSATSLQREHMAKLFRTLTPAAHSHSRYPVEIRRYHQLPNLFDVVDECCGRPP